MKDAAGATLGGYKVELLTGRKVRQRVTTTNDGSFSLGPLVPGEYRLRIRYSGDPFCAPKVTCNSAGCSIQSELKLNPNNTVR